MSVLHLTLKKKWFDMAYAGVKKEEYREIKPYWAGRLLSFNDGMEADSFEEMVYDLKNPNLRHRGVEDLLSYFRVEFRKFDAIRFVNGYAKSSPKFTRESKGISIGIGNPELGAPEGKHVFILKLGEIIK